jgi:23S rRNA (guanosine2251-2'-O)-methyltransferase
MVFFILRHGKEHQIFGIRAIIEAIKQVIQLIYIQRSCGELMKDLMKVMKRANINFLMFPLKN